MPGLSCNQTTHTSSKNTVQGLWENFQNKPGSNKNGQDICFNCKKADNYEIISVVLKKIGDLLV